MSAPATARVGTEESRLRGVLALLACLAVVSAIAVVTGNREEEVPVDFQDVAVGEVGHAQTYDLEVTDVRVAEQVAREYGDPLATTDRFVVVDVVADARTASVTLADMWLVTADGRRYAPRDEFSGSQPPITPAGFTSTGSYVFEIPADALDGVRFLAEPDVPLFEVYDTTLRVDLGLATDSPVTGGVVELAPSTTEATR